MPAARQCATAQLRRPCPAPCQSARTAWLLPALAPLPSAASARPFPPRCTPDLSLPCSRRIKATEPGERLFLSVGCTHPEYGDFFLATFDARLSAQPHLPNETASLGTLLRWVRMRVWAQGDATGSPRPGLGTPLQWALQGDCPGRACRGSTAGQRGRGLSLGLAAHCPAALGRSLPDEGQRIASRRRYGFQPHRVALWIYWHAVLLLWKGVPFYGWAGHGAAGRRRSRLPAFRVGLGAANAAQNPSPFACETAVEHSCDTNADLQLQPLLPPILVQPARTRVQGGSGR